MGLTAQSATKAAMEDIFYIDKNENDFVIALAGNPNTGKSTVFNYLTGLKQHTGNWPGKTVTNARGEFTYNSNNYILVDLPGSYSLFTSSKDEEVARDFVCYGNHDAVIVVTDATCLERNLNLVFQVMEITDNVIMCINLIDEAKKKNIIIDKVGLEKALGIPVILTAARNGTGMNELKEAIEKIAQRKLRTKPNVVRYSPDIENKINSITPILNNHSISNARYMALRLIDSNHNFLSNDNESTSNFIDYKSIVTEVGRLVELPSDKEHIREMISETNYDYANKLKNKYVKEDEKKLNFDRRIDDIVTSKVFGVPLMLLLLGVVLWITIQGANYPSSLLATILFAFQDILYGWCVNIGMPEFLRGVLVLGLYRTLAWVVAVMLPPMAIFFPLFTLLEDLGYLPRVAFNLDHMFKKACAHGKQCLSMCMGLGCNAAGVIGCRIIDSPREKLIAIITNNFVPCNGRFPTLIAIGTIFFAVTKSPTINSIIPALMITLMIIIGVAVTLLISYILSKTILKGIPSTFTLELPPYRVPKIGSLIYTSIIDRTIFVLSRAVLVAAPAGAATWLLANIYIGDLSIINYVANALDPIAYWIGLDGFILMAFIVGLPANEIVIPVLLMAYLSTGSLIEFDELGQLKLVLVDNGWTYLTALNTMLFSLLHWPCTTTLWTIKKETQSVKWTVAAFLIPTAVAFTVCFITTFIYRLIF